MLPGESDGDDRVITQSTCVSQRINRSVDSTARTDSEPGAQNGIPHIAKDQVDISEIDAHQLLLVTA